MADRNTKSRGASAPNPVVKFLPVIIIVAVILLGAGLYFFMPHGSNAPVPGSATPGTAGTAQPSPGTPTTPAPEMSKEQLLKEASTAMRESRLIAPAGNNAVEYYLRVLDKDPNNGSAKDALREMFPIVTPVVEQNINVGNVDEALREIDVLAKADPSNYTLTILRSKLDAKRKQVETEQKQQAAAAAAAAARAANPAVPAAPAPAATETAAASAPAATTTAHAAPTPPPAAVPTPAPAPPPVAAAPVGESHPAELLKSAAPEYPREAFIKHTEGWVEVEFTVTPEGSVTNASVASANPPRVFNEAAMRAVQRWTFKPKLENGKPVEERMKRRIEFKLGAG